MSLAAKLVLALALFVCGIAVGVKWHAGIVAERELEAQSARQEKERNDRKAVDVAAVGHEKDKARIRTEFLTITQEVERVVEKPFYVASEQCLDDDGLRELAAAIGAAQPASQPARAVPGLKPTHWWQPRHDAEVVDRDGARLPRVPEPAAARGAGLAAMNPDIEARRDPPASP